MKITQELVDYVSTLSRHRLPEAEKAAMAAEMEQIVSYMDTLSTLDTEGVEPMSHIFPIRTVLRPARVVPSAPREELLAGAPDGDGETFRVPKAVE